MRFKGNSNAIKHFVTQHIIANSDLPCNANIANITDNTNF